MRSTASRDRAREAIPYLEYSILAYQAFAQSISFSHDPFYMTFCPGAVGGCRSWQACQCKSAIWNAVREAADLPPANPRWLPLMYDYGQIAPWNPVFYGTSSTEYMYCRPSAVALQVTECRLPAQIGSAALTRVVRRPLDVATPVTQPTVLHFFEGIFGSDEHEAGSRTLVGFIAHDPRAQRAVISFRGSRSGTNDEILSGARGMTNPDWSTDLTWGTPTSVQTFTDRAHANDAWAGGWWDACKKVVSSTVSSSLSGGAVGGGVGAAVSWWSGPGALVGASGGALAGSTRGAIGGLMQGLRSCRGMNEVSVQSGFWRSYQSTRTAIRAILASLGPLQEIVTTGHSLGAALAQLAWMDLKATPVAENAIGVASPRVRSFVFSAPVVTTPLALVAFPDHNTEVCHFWSQGDPVVGDMSILRDWVPLGEQEELPPPGISPGFLPHEPAIVLSALRRAAGITPSSAARLSAAAWGRWGVEKSVGAVTTFAVEKALLPGCSSLTGALLDRTIRPIGSTLGTRISSYSGAGQLPTELGVPEFDKLDVTHLFEQDNAVARATARDFLTYYPYSGFRTYVYGAIRSLAGRLRMQFATVLRAIREHDTAVTLGGYFAGEGRDTLRGLNGLVTHAPEASVEGKKFSHIAQFLLRHLGEITRARQLTLG